MSRFKAIQLDPTSRQRTGRQHLLTAESRHLAVNELLRLLGVSLESVRIDPTRTLIQTQSHLWTLVGTPDTPDQQSPIDSASLRRAGAKHKRIR